MASTSSRRTEKAHANPDTFRPKFPLDPFVAATAREPWFVRPDSLPSAVASQARRDVLLVLGGKYFTSSAYFLRLTPRKHQRRRTSTRF